MKVLGHCIVVVNIKCDLKTQRSQVHIANSYYGATGVRYMTVVSRMPQHSLYTHSSPVPSYSCQLHGRQADSGHTEGTKPLYEDVLNPLPTIRTAK